MAVNNYSYQNYNPERMARVLGKSLGISTKVSIEICNYIRGKKVAVAKKLMEEAIALKTPIPFKRFTDGVGHKSGNITSGRFAVKAATTFLKMLNSVESNAADKGLDVEALVIVHINAHKGAQQWHYGRMRRRKMKRTSLEIVVEESAVKEAPKKAPAKKATPKKEAPKAEAKKEEKVAEKKEAKKAEKKAEVKDEADKKSEE